jgi:dihydrofolate reductase
MISIVVALGNGRLHNRVLGKDNKLLWHIPDDLKRFKQLSLGHPVVMGRKTFESILASLGKPLPGRTNIVVTRDASWQHEGAITATSIEDAIEKAKQSPGREEIIIGGGGEIYRQALPFTDRLYLTLIEDDKEGDSFFPEYENMFTKVVSDEAREHEGLKYRWVDLER